MPETLIYIPGSVSGGQGRQQPSGLWVFSLLVVSGEGFYLFQGDKELSLVIWKYTGVLHNIREKWNRASLYGCKKMKSTLQEIFSKFMEG